MKRLATYLQKLTPEQLAALDGMAAAVDLAHLSYPFVDAPDDARKWATAFGEDALTWAGQWADAIAARCAEVGPHCPWPRTVIARAIQRTMETT